VLPCRFEGLEVDEMKTPKVRENERDRERGRPGAEGGDSDAADRAPAAPARDDDTPLGDTDQHSDADA
jgi:hypothetical protein